jgi:hypothetical protein
MEKDSLNVNNKIQMILRQTDYTEEEAKEKLLECNDDHLLVIKKYFGINEKQKPVVSLNQEIYRQLRYKLDSSMREYEARKDSDKSIK